MGKLARPATNVESEGARVILRDGIRSLYSSRNEKRELGEVFPWLLDVGNRQYLNVKWVAYAM